MANTLRFKRGLASGIPTALAGEPLFTTDTFDLYIGNGTTNTRFQKYIASGATTQILRGDGSLYSFPLAISSPTTGQVLKYNGTSWVNDSDSGITGSGSAGQVAYFTGATTQGGSNNLFWDATNSRLGVGTNAPAVTLDVRNGVNLYSFSASFPSAHYLEIISNSNTDGYVNFRRVGAQNGPAAYYITGGNARFSYDGATGNTILGAYTNNPLLFFTNSLERARIFATGNFGINTGATDSGQKLQVIGDIYANASTASYIAQLNQTNTTAGASFGTIIRGGTNVSDSALRVQNAAQTANLLTIQGNGSLGLGTTLLTGYNARMSKTITGSAVAYGIDIDSAIQSDVTNTAVVYGTSVGTQATNFTLSNLYHYNATQGTFGLGSTVTSQYGFRVSSNLTGATNNYAFFGEIAAATGRWNLYMNGTANNYLRGNTAINTTTINDNGLTINQSVNGSNVLLSLRNDAGNTDNEVSIKMIAGSFSAGEFGTILTHRRIGTGGAAFIIKTNATLVGTPAEALRVTQSQNLHVGTFSSDTGEKLQVTGTMKVTGNVAIGTATTSDYNLAIQTANLATLALIDSAEATDQKRWVFQYGTTVGAGTFRLRAINDANTNGQNAYIITRSGIAVQTHQWSTAATTRMTLDASGNLGLGTTSPTSIAGYTTLAVGNATNGGNIDLMTGSTRHASWNNTATETYFGTRSNTPLAITTNATEVARYFANGNFRVGAAAADSGERLQVTGTAKITGALSLGTTVSKDKLLIYDSGSPNQYGIGISSGQLDFYTSSTGSFTFNQRNGATYNELVRINDSGNVGIGVAPSFKLDVNGTFRSVGAATFSSTATITSNLTVDTNTLFVDATNNRVGIGTTSPSDTFHVVGNILAGNGGAFEIMNSSLANVTCIRATGGGSSIMSTASWGNNIAIGTETAHDLILASNNTERMRLSSNGFLQHTNATNPTASVVDSYLQYSNDVTAGNAAPHFRTENGAVIKLYQETTSVGNSIFLQGGGNSVLDDSTFDGYTLRQIVKALRNQGILQ